ncbi:chromatin assembly factor 1 subunit A-domain-containing protein [Bisporella sp. PMI_857]|nr:chromatin assembly factor 1 subunit A-domain-containing protein [Bisporella sp. PMI_857]
MSTSLDTYHSLKRDHDTFSTEYNLGDLAKPFTAASRPVNGYDSEEESISRKPDTPRQPQSTMPDSSFPTPPVSNGNVKRQREPSPSLSRRSSTSSLSEAKSTTPSLRGISPVPDAVAQPTRKSAFDAMKGASQPPAKRAKGLTEQEKEDLKMAKELRDQERAAEKARQAMEKAALREAEKKTQAEEKARKDAALKAEKAKQAEEKRLAREAEKAAKEAEKAAKEAEKAAAKAEKERKKEDEKQRLLEEKRRAADEKKKGDGRQQTMMGFITKASGLSAKEKSVTSKEAAAQHSTPKAEVDPKTVYGRTFADFYQFDDVELAPINRFARDETAAEYVQSQIDSYITGDVIPQAQQSLIAALFNLSSHETIPRGRRIIPVREIMAEITGDSSRPIDLTTDSQNSQAKRTTDLLRQVPMKILKFQEDVRPPYIGTYTSRPVNGAVKLARNPLRRDLPTTNYDYDSEAEWQEDDDAEDLDSEGEEDDIDDDGDDMEGFLDDEGDEGIASRRLVTQGDLEPISTGLCWENQHKKNTNIKMMSYRMEFVLAPYMKSIDPFSSEYWTAAPKITKMEPPRVPLDTLKASSSNINSTAAPTTLKTFFTSTSDPKVIQQPVSTAAHHVKAKGGKPGSMVPQEIMPEFRAAIRNNNLTKVGLIEVLKKKFPKTSAPSIKFTLENIAQRVGTTLADKHWVLLDEINA